MSPPFFNFNRRLPALHTVAALERMRSRAPELAAGPMETRRGISLSSFANQAESENPALSPNVTLGIFQNRARSGETARYATVLNIYALQLQAAGRPEEQNQIRARAMEWAEEALRGIAASGDSERDRVRNLYDCVLALGSILAREGRGEIPAAEQQLLLRFFIQIRAGIERHRLQSEQHPEYEPIPDYFESYARGEQALLEGNAAEALTAFLETRRSIQSLSGSGAFRSRVRNGAEYAILALQRDPSGLVAENLRSRWTLDLLVLFDQVDGGSAAEAQSLSLVALTLAEGEFRGASARGLLDGVQRIPRYAEEEREQILQRLERLYAERPEFRRACEQHLHLAADATPRQVCEELLRLAAAAAQRILAQGERQPYADVFRFDAANRPLREAVEQLQHSAELREAVGVLLGHPNASARILVQELIEYGALAETMLQSLPADLRSQPAFAAFSRAILAVANAGTPEGRRQRLELPLEELFEAMDGLARDDDRYAPAYENFFQGLSEASEEPAPGLGIPESLRHRAGAAAAALRDFNPRRLARHLVSSESLLSLAGGIALTELLPLGILRFARNGGFWVQAERLTWQSELAVGLGVGVAMSTVGGIHHLAASPHPVSEELPRVLPALALNTLFSSLAMGGTMVSGRVGRAMFLEGERSLPLVARHLGVRIWTTGTGGLLQLGAGTLSEGLLTGRWEAPNREVAAETYLNLLLWDAGAAGLRRIGNRYWWRAQLGPRVAREGVDRLANLLTARNRWFVQTEAERQHLQNYLGSRLASGRSLEAVEAGLATGLEPYWRNGEIDFRSPTPGSRARLPYEAPRAGNDALAAPAADEGASPLVVEQRVSDAVHNVSFENLQRLWNLPMRPLPREILSSPILRPIHRVQAGVHEFFLSRVLECVDENGSRRRYVLALTPTVAEGQTVLKRRFFYISNSDAGGWRATPYMAGDHHIAKGVGRHYTQETQPIWELNEALIRLEREGPPPFEISREALIRYISLSSPALGEAGVRTMALGFEEEVEFPSVRGISDLRNMQPGEAFALPPGWGWGNRADVAGTLQAMHSLVWPEGFIPDFSRAPARELLQPNSLLGPVTFREYLGAYGRDRNSGRNRPLVWIVGEDGAGRAWIRHLYFEDSPVNSYGVYSDVVDSGILTSKPLEYSEQAGLLSEPYARPFNGEYVDISPALTLLEPIRRYREARGLSPLLGEADLPTLRMPEE